MPGRKNRRRKRSSAAGSNPKATNQKPEPEVSPELPTSGQILGVLIKSLGINDQRLQSKTARRYFSGRLENRVRESIRTEIIEAVSDTLVNSVFAATPAHGEESSSALPALAVILKWHAVNWDRLRAFLQPRMMRVLPHHLDAVWQAYVRLAAVDLALRAAAHVHLAAAAPETLEILDWASIGRRGVYLNNKRSKAGISLSAVVELVGVNENTVEAWLYHGSRPSDDHLGRIANALAPNGDLTARNNLLRELRRLYWGSDVAEIVGGFVGPKAVDEIVGRLGRYASLMCHIIDDKIAEESRSNCLDDLATLGAYSPFAEPLLAALASRESDDEWKDDLLAAGSDWIDWTRRVLTVNLRVHQGEEDALIQETEGRLLQDWDVSNPEAYEHYRGSYELQIQGRLKEAVAELEKAVELDPLDPANHFTLGSVKSSIGKRHGNAALVSEGLESCWIATTLDPKWILPWTEIGLILLESGRATEAVEHLKGVKPECGPLDSRYHTALGAALRELGKYAESLEGFESALFRNPDDPAGLLLLSSRCWPTIGPSPTGMPRQPATWELLTS